MYGRPVTALGPPVNVLEPAAFVGLIVTVDDPVESRFPVPPVPSYRFTVNVLLPANTAIDAEHCSVVILHVPVVLAAGGAGVVPCATTPTVIDCVPKPT